MDADDWKLELQRLFEMFERESTISLRKVHRCFEVLGRPFGDEFRRYFLKMTTVRLDTSFDAVLMEHQFDNNMEMPSTSRGHNDSDEIANNLIIRSSAEANVDSLNTTQNDNLFELKIEKSDDAPIEIIDSDDDSVLAEEHVESRMANEVIDDLLEPNVAQHTEEANGHSDGKHDGIDLNDENDDEDFVKFELKSEIVEEMVDLPFEVFNPVKENESSNEENRASVPESMDGQTHARTSSSCQNEAKRIDDRRFKCNDCAYTSNHKSNFQSHRLTHGTIKPFKCEHCDYASNYQQVTRRHQRVHVQQKLMGVSQDSSDGQYKCTHCDQRFTKWNSFQMHYKQSHKNNQRLFNCVRCMRRFTQKAEKDRHEVRCQTRRYECYLCKTYVTRSLAFMQDHLRTHLGAKPFECAVCMKCFGSRNNLKRHLNAVHSRISA